MNGAGFDGRTQSRPNHGWSLPDQETRNGHPNQYQIVDEELVKSVPQDLDGRSRFFLSQQTSGFPPIGFDIRSAAPAPPDDSPGPGCGAQSSWSQPHQRSDWSDSSCFRNQGAFDGHMSAYETTLWNLSHQQNGATSERMSVSYGHRYNGVSASSELDWLKMRHGGCEYVDTGLPQYKQAHVNQYGVEVSRNNGVTFPDNGMSYGSSRSPNQEMVERTENCQSLADMQCNSSLNLQTEPWSVVNRRDRSIHTPADEQMIQFGSPETIYSGVQGFDRLSSGPEDVPETSVTSLNSDNDDMMRSFDTIRGLEPSSRAQSQYTGQVSVPLEQRRSTPATLVSTQPAAGIQPKIRKSSVRERTSLCGQGSSFESRVDAPSLHMEGLSIPRREGSNSEAASSPISTTSPSTSDVALCTECSIEFSGEYRKGNLSRHQRLKHKGQSEYLYHCDEEYCDKTFKRQDARLKHYRRHHPHLVVGPVVPRGPQGQRRSSNGQAVSAGQEPQDQVLRSISGWAEERTG